MGRVVGSVGTLETRDSTLKFVGLRPGVRTGTPAITDAVHFFKEKTMWFISKKKVPRKDPSETANFYEYVYAAEGYLKDAMKKIALVPNKDRSTARVPLLRMRKQIHLLTDLTEICHTCNQNVSDRFKEDTE